jgi:hypothetical protein
MIVLRHLIACMVLASIVINNVQASRGGGNRHSNGSTMRHAGGMQRGGGMRHGGTQRGSTRSATNHTRSTKSTSHARQSKNRINSQASKTQPQRGARKKNTTQAQTNHTTKRNTHGTTATQRAKNKRTANRQKHGRARDGRTVVHNHYHHNHFGLWRGVPSVAWWSPYAAFWGPYIPYTFFGLGFTFYPSYGLWYSRPWGTWMYPGGLWFDPRLGAWYSLWAYSLYWHTAYTEDNRPYVVVDNSGSKTLWGAVYERNGNTFEQVEAPREIRGKRQENLFLKNRSDNQVIIMAQSNKQLPAKLTDKDLGEQHQVIRYNTQSVSRVQGDPDQAAAEFNARVQERKATMHKVAPKLTSSPSKNDSDKTADNAETQD